MREYIDHELGGLNKQRLAKEGLDVIFVMALQSHHHQDNQRLSLLSDAGHEYLEDIDEGPVRRLYSLALTIATLTPAGDEVWGVCARLGGGEDQWRENSTLNRYRRQSLAAEQRMERTHTDAKAVRGFISWGADDEDRLAKLGTMPMYFTAGDDYREGTSAALNHFISRVKRQGYYVGSKADQRLDVEFGSSTTTVWRLTYEGLRKKGAKIAGGYAGS